MVLFKFNNKLSKLPRIKHLPIEKKIKVLYNLYNTFLEGEKMSRTSNCIRMLQMLNSGRTIKISEFADEFETNARNIIEYRKELEDAGYTIETIPGKFGGYKLDKSVIFPSLKLTNDEKKSLIEAYEYVKEKKDYMYKKDFEVAFQKIISNNSYPEINNDLLVVDKYQLTMSEAEVLERYKFIEKAINEKKEIEIEYNSLKNGKKRHILHPYKLFIYNNSWFVLALNPEVYDVWNFKINRIDSFKFTNKKFNIWKNFDEKEYIDKFGFRNNGEFYHIELIANNKRAMLMQEREYGKNQVVEKIDDMHVKVSLDMQNKELILSYILQCGSDVEVIEPQWLKEELITKIKSIINIYNVGE